MGASDRRGRVLAAALAAAFAVVLVYAFRAATGTSAPEPPAPVTALPVRPSPLTPGVARRAVDGLPRFLRRAPRLIRARVSAVAIDFQNVDPASPRVIDVTSWVPGGYVRAAPLTPGFDVTASAFAPGEVNWDAPAILAASGPRLGLDGWTFTLAEGFVRGAPVGDGVRIVWVATFERGRGITQVWANASGAVLRVVRVV